MILVDSHCHLNMLISKEAPPAESAYNEIAQFIVRANKADVQYFQTICTELEEFDTIINIANNYDNVFASAGIHPNEVDLKINEQLTTERLVSLAANKKVTGIGETGLDYFYNHDKSQQASQKSSFIAHIHAASITDLPVIIHTRAAEVDTLDIVKSIGVEFDSLIHCFTASKEFAAKVLDLGMYISIAGIVTFSKAEELREIVRFVPLDRLLLETDSPYLAPVPMRGKVNEPAFIHHTARLIAELKGISLEELAAKTTANFFTLFKKACP